MRNNKNTKKTKSLRKVILWGLAILYSAILILLLIMDVSVIYQHRQSVFRNWDSRNTTYTDAVATVIEEVNRNMYATYAYDQNYNELKTAVGVDSYVDAYELTEKLKGYINETADLTGYVLYYDGFERRDYKFASNYTGVKLQEEIKEITELLINGQEVRNSWYFVHGNLDSYAICVYKEVGVALCEFISLGQIKENFRKYPENENVTPFFIYNGNVLGLEEEKEAFEPYVDQILSGDFKISEDGYYISGYQVNDTDFYVCTAIKVNRFVFFSEYGVILVLITMVAIATVIILYVKMKNQLLRPLRNLTDQMNQMSLGSTIPFDSGSTLEELQQVSDTLNSMLLRLHEQEKRTYEETIERQKSQMQYLSMQLKPHFYLNGLKALNAVAINGDTEKIQDIVLQLSEHLRGKLHVEQELVTLESEKNYTNNYISLQKNITDRSIVVDWKIQEGIKEWWVPNLCIQTFAENSVKYAKLGNIMSELHIAISVTELNTEDGEYLDISISDNGAGYSEELLSELNDGIKDGAAGIGIDNLMRRCRLLYDDRAQFVFYNDGGAVSELIIPWKKNGEGREEV